MKKYLINSAFSALMWTLVFHVLIHVIAHYTHTPLEELRSDLYFIITYFTVLIAIIGLVWVETKEEDKYFWEG